MGISVDFFCEAAQNEGAIAALIPALSMLGAVLAGAAAWVAIAHNRRANRSKLILAIGDPPADDRVAFQIMNRGAATPALCAWATVTRGAHPEGGGGDIDPPSPGELVQFDIPARLAAEGTHIEITWVDQDGSKHSQRRWYQTTGDSDKDQRNDLAPPGKLLRKVFPDRSFDRKPPRR